MNLSHGRVAVVGIKQLSEPQIFAAIRIQPSQDRRSAFGAWETAPQYQPAVRLNQDFSQARKLEEGRRLKGHIEGQVGQQARQSWSAHCMDRFKVASHQDPPVRQGGDDLHIPVQSAAGTLRRVVVLNGDGRRRIGSHHNIRMLTGREGDRQRAGPIDDRVVENPDTDIAITLNGGYGRRAAAIIHVGHCVAAIGHSQIQRFAFSLSQNRNREHPLKFAYREGVGAKLNRHHGHRHLRQATGHGSVGI